MTEAKFFSIALWTVFALAPITWIALTRIVAPYGRHVRSGWGPQLSSKAGWLLMEAPASLAFAAIYAVGEHRARPASLALLALWQLHYVHRSFIFPLRRKASHKPMPLLIACMGLCFNLLNAYLNARWISQFGVYDSSWLADPRWLAGALMFLAGWSINVHADNVLLSLRKGDDAGYRIPRGGLYRWVSCPNYLGELIEWIGFALACWSLPALSFALYTAANLVPRAVSNHAWYRRTFPDYPPERKAIVPFLY